MSLHKKSDLKKSYLSGSTMALGDLSGEGQSLQWLAMLEDAAHAARSCQSLYDANYRDKLEEKKGLAKFFCLGKKSSKNKTLEYNTKSKESLFETPINETRKSQTLREGKEGTFKKRNKFSFPFRSLQSKPEKYLPRFQFEKVSDLVGSKGHTVNEKRVLGEDIIEEVFGKTEVDQNSNVIESPIKLRKKKPKSAMSRNNKTEKMSKNIADKIQADVSNSSTIQSVDDDSRDSIYRPTRTKEKNLQQRKNEINIPKMSIDFIRPSTEIISTIEIVDDKENIKPSKDTLETKDNLVNDNIVEPEKHNNTTVKKRLSARDENVQAYINREGTLKQTKVIKDKVNIKNNKPLIKKQTSTPILRLDGSPTRQSFKSNSTFKKDLERFTVYQQNTSQIRPDSSLVEWNTNAVYESKSVAGLIKEESLKFLKGRPSKNNIKKCCLTLEWVETKTETINDTTYTYKKAEIRLDYDLTKPPKNTEETVKIIREADGKVAMQIVRKIDGKDVLEEVINKNDPINQYLLESSDAAFVNKKYLSSKEELVENPKMIMDRMRQICRSPNMTSSNSQSSLMNTSYQDTGESYSQDSSFGIFCDKSVEQSEKHLLSKLTKDSTSSSSTTFTIDKPPITPPRKSRLSLTFEPLNDKREAVKYKMSSPTTPRAIDKDDDTKNDDENFSDKKYDISYNLEDTSDIGVSVPLDSSPDFDDTEDLTVAEGADVDEEKSFESNQTSESINNTNIVENNNIEMNFPHTNKEILIDKNDNFQQISDAFNNKHLIFELNMQKRKKYRLRLCVDTMLCVHG